MFKNLFKSFPAGAIFTLCLLALFGTAWALVTNLDSLTLDNDLIVMDDATIVGDLTAASLVYTATAVGNWKVGGDIDQATGEINSTSATVTALTATRGYIADLNSTTEISSASGTFTALTGTRGYIADLAASSEITTASLTATAGTVTTLTSTTAGIDDLTSSGEINSVSITNTALFRTLGDVQLDDAGADAQVGTANIRSGSVTITSSKIDSGSWIFLTFTSSPGDDGPAYVSSLAAGSAVIGWASNIKTNKSINWIIIND